MSGVSVWAPHAARVQLVVQPGKPDQVRTPMVAEGRGWWRSEVGLVAGTPYAFSLDGGEPLPDPRSRFQPQGVDGPSQVDDPTAFGWTDGSWEGRVLDGTSLVYELHVGTFTPDGTFDGVAGRLDHLVDLGVTHVELLPVAEFPGRWGWGYDGVDLWAARAAYGGPEGLRRLVDACHARGLAVVLDVVYNHLGPAGNHLERFGPYFTDRYRTPWGKAVNFDDAGSDEVRAFVVDNALMWLGDYHVDGLRLDAVHAICDTSATHVLEQLAMAVDELEVELGRAMVLIAESDLNDPRLVRDPAQGGYGLDAQWSDDFHHALHALLTGERAGWYGDFGSMDDLAKALRQGYVYDGTYSASRHRRHGRSPSGVAALRFVGYVQTHDQVGNRARGERIGHLVGEARLRVAAALVLCGPFVPMLFAGEEWNATAPFLYFCDHEAELGRAVSEGRRREFAAFGWAPSDVPDPQAPATFEASRLDWSEVERAPHAGLLDWHRRLVRLRRETPALSDGSFVGLHVHTNDEAGWILMQRGPVTVAANLGSDPVGFDVSEGNIALASGDAVLESGRLRLGPDSVAVVV